MIVTGSVTAKLLKRTSMLMFVNFFLYGLQFSAMTVEYLYLEVMFHYATSLTAKIQGMKNAVPKNDKKRRKQLADEVAKLEAELEQKHKEELKQLKEASPELNKVGALTLAAVLQVQFVLELL